MKRLTLLFLVALAAASPALTFQFVSKSSRKILVPTAFKAVTDTGIQRFFMVGEAGTDLLIQRIDKFANVEASVFYDGPGASQERVLDIVVDNFNQPVVLYTDGNGATRLAKFDATLGNQYDIPVGSNDRLLQLHEGLAGTVIAGGEDSNGDIVLKKFATNGSIVWRTVVLESGSTDFTDMAVGPGEEVAVSGGNADQGLIARLRGSDGARTATFVTAVTASPSNRILTLAFGRDTSFLFAAGNQNGNPTAYRINTPNNAKIEATIPSFPVGTMDIAVGSGATPRVAVVGSVINGMRLAIISSGDLSAGIGVETHPQNPRALIPSGGNSIFAYGDAGTQLAIPNVLARFDNTGLRTFSVEALTDLDGLLDASEFFDNGILAVGSSRDANDSRVGLVVAANSFGPLFRYTERPVHHPERRLVDAVTDSAGAHYQLNSLRGSFEAPFVVKHSATGQQIWGAQLSFANLPFLRPIGMAMGPNGHLVVACVGKTTDGSNNGEWVLFQLNNSNGSIRWSKILPIGNPGTGAPADIDIHSDNSIGIVGRVKFFGIDNNFASARLSTTGTVQWTRIFQTLGPDQLNACRFRPTGELVAIGLVGGSFPGRMQLLTYNTSGGLNNQSVIEETDGTTQNFRLDMETTGNIVVSYTTATSVPLRTVVRRMNPITGLTIASTALNTGGNIALSKASPDGNVWVAHVGQDGIAETFRMNGTSGAVTQLLNLPTTAQSPVDMAVRSDNSLVLADSEFNGTVSNTLLVRRLATGGQAALRRLAGTPTTVRNAPGTAVWIGGDVASRNRGSEQYAAKYTVP